MAEKKYIVPIMEEVFGSLQFAGIAEVKEERVGGRKIATFRSFNLYSDVQRADEVQVKLPGAAKEKRFEYMSNVRLVNPRLYAVGVMIGDRAFVEYILEADDMIEV